MSWGPPPPSGAPPDLGVRRQTPVAPAREAGAPRKSRPAAFRNEINRTVFWVAVTGLIRGAGRALGWVCLGSARRMRGWRQDSSPPLPEREPAFREASLLLGCRSFPAPCHLGSCVRAWNWQGGSVLFFNLQTSIQVPIPFHTPPTTVQLVLNTS